MIKAIFFDAVGTLFYLTKSVGDHYALVGNEVGLKLDPAALERAFFAAWKRMPPRAAIDGPRQNDDKDWWRELVDLVLEDVAPSLSELDRDNFFEIAYEHFAEAGVWDAYPEVVDVLEKLQPRFQLAVVSNFDGRLRMILEHLGISKFFTHVLFRVRSARTNPIRKSFGAHSSLSILRPLKSCMPATIRCAIGRQRGRRDCRSFNWIERRIRCAICQCCSRGPVGRAHAPHRGSSTDRQAERLPYKSCSDV